MVGPAPGQASGDIVASATSGVVNISVGCACSVPRVNFNGGDKIDSAVEFDLKYCAISIGFGWERNEKNFWSNLKVRERCFL